MKRWKIPCCKEGCWKHALLSHDETPFDEWWASCGQHYRLLLSRSKTRDETLRRWYSFQLGKGMIVVMKEWKIR